MERKVFTNAIRLKSQMFTLRSLSALIFVHLREVLVEDGSLEMSDVQVSARLGWETCYDLSLLGVFESKGEG